MTFKKQISLLTSLSLLAQPIAPVLAVQISSMSELEENVKGLSQFKSVPAALNFKADSNTAAGVLHYAEHEGEIWIPLGLRDDKKEWCNFGGKSDAEETPTEGASKSKNPLKDKNQTETSLTLADTADRETREESNTLYAHHPRILRHSPFIDIYTEKAKGDLLYRMYWKKVHYLAPEVFKEKLKTAKDHHSQEYTDFKWVKAKDLLEAVQEENRNLGNEENPIFIYEPLFETLSTDSGVAFLKELTTFKKLNPFKKRIRPLVNRLYILSEEIENPKDEEAIDFINDKAHADFKVHWDLPTQEWWGTSKEFDFDKPYQKPKLDSRIPTKYTPIPFGKDGFGRTQGQKSLLEKEKRVDEDKVTFNTQKEEDIFAEAVAAHGAAMVELKKSNRFAKNNNNNTIPHVSTPHWNPNQDETLSRIHLRIILGPDYKEPKDFPKSENSKREADLTNIKEYFKRYNSAEFEQKGKVEFKRKINFLESDFEMFADVMAYEEKNKKWPTFFHAASANLNNLFKSFTYLRELIGVKAFNEQLALRGTDIYFKDFNNIAEVLKKIGYEDYANNRASMILCLNYVLLAGLATTRTSSSSIEYVINDHSVEEQNLNDRFEEAMVLAGFAKPIYDYFQSIFEQFVAHKHPELGNSVMLPISINPDILEDNMYAAHGGGASFDLKDDKDQTTNSPLHVLRGLQSEGLKQKSGKESFETDKERKRNLIPEARFFLHPKNMLNPGNVKVKAFNRFPLSEKEEKAYDQEMRQTSITMLADWLAQKNKVLSGSFQDYPLLKTLYKWAYKGLTGEEVQESLAVDGFLYLIRHGHTGAVETYLKLYPDIIQKGGIDQKSLMRAAMDSNNPQCLEFVFTKILNAPLQKFVSDDHEFTKIVRTLLTDNKDKSLVYFIENYNISKIDDKIKLFWIKASAYEDYNLSVTHAVVKKAPHLFEQALEILLKSGLSADCFQSILDSKMLTPQDLLVKFSDYVRNGDLKEYHETVSQLKKLLENGVDLSALHPQTQDPIIFSLLATESIINDISVADELKKIKGLLDLKNKKGFTLLEVAQKTYLEGQMMGGLITVLIQALQNAKRDVGSAYDKEFLELFGTDYIYFYGDNVLQKPQSRQWIEKAKKITQISELPGIVNECPSSILLNIFSQRFSNLSVLNLLQAKANKNYEIMTNWKTQFTEVVKKNDESKMKELISNAPESITEYEAEFTDLEEKFKTPLEGRFGLLEEKSKNWTKELESMAKKGEEALRNFLHKVPSYIWYTNSEIYEILKNYTLDFYNAYVIPYEKATHDWTSELQILKEDLTKQVNESAITKFEKHLKSAPNPGAFNNWEFSNTLRLLMKDERLIPLLEACVNFATHSQMAFIESPYTVSLFYSDPDLSDKAIVSFLNLLSPQQQTTLLKKLDEDNFEDLLSKLPLEFISKLLNNNPELFKNHGENKDFFGSALWELPLELRKEFALSHIDELLKNEPELNTPYFVCLLFTNDNKELVETLIKKKPTFLDIQSEDGLSLSEIIESFPSRFKNGTMLFGMLEKRLKTKKSEKN
ncbi:NUDIX domain-containing protein [Candidatus Bealeia paramacronuclearis]|uniref:NUDIX domain-containing protein n=1 Tax=Candidatus Bealeia paramacronuclearis TaxID=1921001 RepID=A0ABZ2C8D9_9PROT|nr:NUDIX domain-containing protein [Candidatus Bealeia paramacronuclearis]